MRDLGAIAALALLTKKQPGDSFRKEKVTEIMGTMGGLTLKNAHDTLKITGAGDGNRTHDIQLGKLACLQADQRASCKTAPIVHQSHQRLRAISQNQRSQARSAFASRIFSTYVTSMSRERFVRLPITRIFAVAQTTPSPTGISLHFPLKAQFRSSS
jgi:hypothetical protein